MSLDASHIAAGERGGTAYLFSPDNGMPLFTYDTGGYIAEVSMDYNGNYFAAAGETGLYVFSTANEADLLWHWAYTHPSPEDELTYHWDFGEGTVGTGATPTHIYGDDGIYTVTLTVTNTAGLVDTDTCTITVNNVPPTIESKGIFFTSEIAVRVAGTPGNIVSLVLEQEETVVGCVEIVRTSGPPDQTTLYADIDLTKPYIATLHYESAGGRGANPVWFIIDGNMTYITTFVSHPRDLSSHYQSYDVELSGLLTMSGKSLVFTATASDPGSDDLIFTWDFGDGTPPVSTIYYNDGIGPDPYPSPWGTFPFFAEDTVYHTYACAGTYEVTLTVTDDDGGVSTSTVEIVIHG